jgi:hypothetical protein
MKMNILKRTLVSLAFLCVALTSSFAAKELLYLQEGQKIVTYSVDNTTAVSNKLGTMFTKFDPDFNFQICPSGSYLYILGFISEGNEMFAVYPLTTAGVPIAKPIQTLAVKPALSQFMVHPNGIDAYGMFSWTQVVGGQTKYVSDIVLFTINPKTGKLTNTTKPVANFPLNARFQTAMYGMNSKGSKLYMAAHDVGTGVEGTYHYSYSTINAKTGALGTPIAFWSDTVDPSKQQNSAFSDSLIAQVGERFDTGGTFFINLYPNKAGVNPKDPLIHCTSEMLMVCGDNTANPVLHPSGKYLFFYDESINQQTVVYINTALKKFQATGASVPGASIPTIFSRDGLLAYVVQNTEILVNVFNPHSGLFTATSTIDAPGLLKVIPGK